MDSAKFEVDQYAYYEMYDLIKIQVTNLCLVVHSFFAKNEQLHLDYNLHVPCAVNQYAQLQILVHAIPYLIPAPNAARIV